MAEETLAVAKVGRSHGLKGEFRVWMLSEGADTLEHTRRLVLEADDGRRQEFAIRAVRSAGRGVIVRVEGIRFRDEAEAWKHAVVHVFAADLPELPDDEWYEFELRGLPVVLVATGEVVGEVESIFDNGGHDVLVVVDGDTEFQVPFVDGMAEVEDERVLIDPPEGLIEVTRSARTEARK